MTTATAENLSARAHEKPADKKDDKVEKRRALGRGLESLLPGPRVVAANPAIVPARPDAPAPLDPARHPATPHLAAPAAHPISPSETPAAASPQTSGDVILSLNLDSIDKNPYQTRTLFDEAQLIELRDSIQQHGVVQPVVVRPAPEASRYILVLGERRLRASKMAGKETVPALVRRISPQQAAEMTVLENVVREDLNPIEQAEAYRVLSQEFNLTQAQIAQRIGVSRESVSNHMRLLRLPEEIRQHVAAGRLSFSDAREILSLENAEHIRMVADDLINRRLRWDELKDRIARLNGGLPPTLAQPESRGARWIDPNVRAAQMEIERLLGVRVKINDRNGKGKIVIEYASVDDYDRVVDMLSGGKKN
jgi:ParB family transcriptional regulator, chromosome partitioning protein